MSELFTAIRDASGGDLKAFTFIVNRFKNMAYAYSYSKLGDFCLAEDAAQEAFFEAFLKIKTLQHPQAFANWFKKIVHKQCDRIWRKKIVLMDISQVPENIFFGKSISENPFAEDVTSALKSLPATYRVIISLFHIEEYSQKEISDFLCIPVTTVKKRLLLARSKLKEIIMDDINSTLHAHALDEKFSKRIILELRKRPNLMQLNGHELYRTKKMIRHALPEYKVIKPKEIIETEKAINTWSLQFAYSPDKRHVLCTDLLDVTLEEMQKRKEPLKIITFGREFYHKAAHLNNKQIVHAFSLLCIGPEVSKNLLYETVLKIARCFSQDAEIKYETWDFDIFDPCLRAQIKINGEFKPMIGCGMLSKKILGQAGYDFHRINGFAIEFSLEDMILLKASLL